MLFWWQQIKAIHLKKHYVVSQCQRSVKLTLISANCCYTTTHRCHRLLLIHCNLAFTDAEIFFRWHAWDQAFLVTDSTLCAVQWLWTSRHQESRWTWTKVASSPMVALDTSSNRASCAAPSPTLTQRTREEAPVTSPPSWLFEWVVTYWVFWQTALLFWHTLFI